MRLQTKCINLFLLGRIKRNAKWRTTSNGMEIILKSKFMKYGVKRTKIKSRILNRFSITTKKRNSAKLSIAVLRKKTPKRRIIITKFVKFCIATVSERAVFFFFALPCEI